GDDVRIYSHVATGNYHSETAKAYEDLGLLTADTDIGHDVTKVFNFFTGHTYHEDYRKLLVAPGNMRKRFVELIRNEVKIAQNGGDARIIIKTNRLEDPEIVKELYEASMAGVDIDLIVRDICRLRSGIEGVSENIDVRSIVGRFLEHSRIFYFGNDGESKYFIGSADLMTRNLDNRVEAIAPVEDDDLRDELDEMLGIYLKDNTKSWEMNSDGTYEQNKPEDEDIYNAQKIFMQKAREAINRR
ncbi:MAG: polyphosphate kinase 1, partial [Halobacteria archaeon]|nr:polyphosphate kinase 1 [Halobacteria archaeon]